MLKDKVVKANVMILSSTLPIVMAVMLLATTIVVTAAPVIQSAHAAMMASRLAWPPLVMTGNNIYITWSSNKSGDFEVLFRASTDGGNTFGPKINLSNTPGVASETPEIAAEGKNVAVSWFENKDGTSEAVLRVSHDNGKTFGEMIMLSSNTTSAS